MLIIYIYQVWSHFPSTPKRCSLRPPRSSLFQVLFQALIATFWPKLQHGKRLLVALHGLLVCCDGFYFECEMNVH